MHEGRITEWLYNSAISIPLLVLAASLLAIGLTAYHFTGAPADRELFIVTQALLLLLAAASLAVLLYRVHDQLSQPLTQIHQWLYSLRGGNFSARVRVPDHGEFVDLAAELNRLSDEYKALVYDVDEMVSRQTESLAQKTRSLEILYDVAARLNTSRDLNDLLARSLKTLMEIVDARAGTVRLAQSDGTLKLVASIGLDNSILSSYELVSGETYMVGSTVSEGEILRQTDPRRYDVHVARPLFNGELLEMITVPLQHRAKNLGICKLFIDKPQLIERQDIKELLTSIGQHLGMAIEKARLDAESQRLSIMQERAMLANELHDSLAQTFASLRFQIRMLDVTLQQLGNKTALQEIEDIEQGLDQANQELRELMAHFRVRMDERGLIPALEETVSRFQKDTGISAFFQKDCPHIELPPDYEVQVLRIVQEALANVRKHSQAHTARVLLHCNDEGDFRVLVEDDGVGIDESAKGGGPGEHIGQSVMQERAQQLDGGVTVESEHGEGTQVLLTFRYPGRSPDKAQLS